MSHLSDPASLDNESPSECGNQLSKEDNKDAHEAVIGSQTVTSDGTMTTTAGGPHELEESIDHEIFVKEGESQTNSTTKGAEQSVATGAGTKLFRTGYDAQPGDVFIAIMGVTGAGKSTFISHCTEKQLEIGHGLHGCTKRVSVHLCKYRPDVNVYLIDTPGFDDTNRSDTEVLREIAAWLTASYSFSIKLHGIIYLHRVTDLRMQGSAKRNLFLFRRLCGDEALRNVILATTMWERVEENDGKARERELEETPEFWGLMKEKGSQIVRHYNSRESAMRLLEIFVSKPRFEATVVLDIQSQMVDGGRTLAATDAGQEMDSSLSKERTKFEEELTHTRTDKQEALAVQDQESASLLTEHEQETAERIRQLKAEQENLKVTMERLHQEKLAELRNELESIRTENRETSLALEKTKQQSEQERAIFERERATSMNVERSLSHSLEETQKRLTQLFQEPSGQRQEEAPDTSVALFAVYHSFVGSVKTESRPPPGFPTSKQIPNGRTRYVAIGDQDSYYIHYHTIDGRCCTLLSKNFSRVYPGAHRHIIDNKQFGCPKCVSLGTHGNGFIRTEGGVWHNLRRSTTTKLGDMGEIESLWLGSRGAYVAVRKDGTTTWDLKGGYFDLHVCLQLVCHAPGNDGSAIKALAMNPHDAKQWIAVFQDGRTSFNEGKGYTFDGSVYTKWCTENFGITKLIPTGPAASGTDGLPELETSLIKVELDTGRETAELETSLSKVELDTVRETAELETNVSAPPLPPRSPVGLVEQEDTGGPTELPADTAQGSRNSVDTLGISMSKSPSTFRNRLSKLKLSRKIQSPSSGTGPAEPEGR